MTVAATDAGGIQEIMECSEITVYSMKIEDYQKQAEKAQRPNEMKNESTNERTNERTNRSALLRSIELRIYILYTMCLPFAYYYRHPQLHCAK